MTLGILALVGPYLVLAFTLRFALGRDLFDSGWSLLAVGGSLVFGIGPFNLIAEFLHQYLGHRVTVVCLVAGSCMMAAAAYFAPNVG